MNGKWYNINNLRYWYFRYKDTQYYSVSLIIITLCVCLFLIFQIIIPQFEDWFSIRAEVVSVQQEISSINQNINFIISLNKQALSQQLRIATAAMPDEKSFGDISNAITYAAETANVSLEDYSFQVENESDSTTPGVSYTDLSLVVDGNMVQVTNFIHTIYQELPIAAVKEVSATSLSANITLVFYSKTEPRSSFSTENSLSPITASQISLLNKLSLWQQNTLPQSSVNASSSPVPLF